MDDIKVVCEDEFQARRALKDLSLELREIHLAVNSKKTEICRKDDPEGIGRCLDMGGSELQQIHSAWNTRAVKPITRSFPMLRDLTLRLLQSNRVDSREFRFCMHRLETLALCSEIEVPDEYFAPITDHIVPALTANPAVTDELARYLRAVPTSKQLLDNVGEMLLNSQRFFYNWQNYRLWVLLVEKEHRSPRLLAHALDIVRNSPDNPTRSGATLYLGAIGTKNDRIAIAQNFGRLTSFLGQRSALLASQELHFTPHIRDSVQPHLRADLVNVYRSLGRKGIYCSRPEAISLTRVIDVDRHYD